MCRSFIFIPANKNSRPSAYTLRQGKAVPQKPEKARIDLSDFLTHCRNQGFFDLSQIQTAVFEYNGSLSLLPVETARPVTPADMDMQPEQQEIMVNVILDGNVNKENLKKTGNNDVWLEKQLHAQGYHTAKEIYLGAVNTADNTLSLYPQNVKNDSSDLFE